MTSTRRTVERRWTVLCRCGWVPSETWPTREKARVAGDAHLDEANETDLDRWDKIIRPKEE